MKYLVRALKYFLYLLVILTLTIAVLIVAKVVDGDLSQMFVHGYDSLWQIAAIMAVFALIYPKLGYSTRTAHVYGSPKEVRPKLMNVMDLHGYRLEKEEGETITFVKRSPAARAFRMWEDRLTVSPTAAGLEIEGLTKELVRIVSGLEANQECE